jgi:hypothetical protein
VSRRDSFVSQVGHAGTETWPNRRRIDKPATLFVEQRCIDISGRVALNKPVTPKELLHVPKGLQ